MKSWVRRSTSVGDAPGRRLGSLISAAFGLIYVEANSGDLPTVAATLLRIGGAVVFVGLVAALALARPASRPHSAAERAGFGRGYWVTVALEAGAILAGNALLAGPLHLSDAVVAWISLVVGVHFFALAAIWNVPLFRTLGTALALCGVAGVTAAAAGASHAIVATVGGVLPGGLLLAAALRGAAD